MFAVSVNRIHTFIFSVLMLQGGGGVKWCQVSDYMSDSSACVSLGHSLELHIKKRENCHTSCFACHHRVELQGLLGLPSSIFWFFWFSPLTFWCAHILSSVHETVLWKRRSIKTYKLCDLDLTLTEQLFTL